jgi:hypothetical protein
MRVMRAAVVLSAVLAMGIVAAPSAAAGDWALNGRYAATWNGDWAQTNDVYKNEGTVRSTWTITMTCSNATTCSGRVTSDAGWTGDIIAKGTEYLVTHDIPNWEPCADGTMVTGHQSTLFYPVNVETGYLDPGSRTFAGNDKTSGESGGCRLNDKLEVQMPFRLEKLD